MKRSMWIKSCLVLLLGFFAIGSGVACAAEKLVLQLRWHHQFQFAGYYMAEEKGYYSDAGLDVEIRDITQGSNVVEEVLSGRAGFGVSNSGLLVERSMGKPVVAVSAIFQQDPAIFLTLEQSGIREPADFIGKKVMLSPGFSSLSLLALLYQEKLLDKVELLETSFDYHSLLNGETDVFNAYQSNEPFVLETQGYGTNIINPEDYGIHFYGDILFTSEAFLQDNPKQVEKFRTASLKGWGYALSHPDETIAVIRSKYHVEKTVQQLQFEAAAIEKVIQPDLVDIGTMDRARWAQIGYHLKTIGQIHPGFKWSSGFLYEPPLGIQWQKLRPWIIGVLAAFTLLLVSVGIISKANFRLRATRKQLRGEMEERKRTVEALRESEEKYRALFSNAPLSYQSLDEGGFIVDINPAWLKTLGYEREEVIGQRYGDFLHPDWKAHFEESFPAFKKRGYVSDVQFKIRHKDGHYLDVSFEGRIGYTSDGKLKQTYCVFQDITERKQAEDALWASEHKFRLLADHTHDWEYWKEPSGKYLYLSPACEKITGYSQEEFMSNPELLFDIVTPEYSKKTSQHYNDENNEETPLFSMEFSIVTRNGEKRWLEHNCIPIFDEEGHYVGRRGNNRDITKRKQLEDERSQLLQAIDQSSEAIVITDIVGTIQYVNPAFEKTSGYTSEEVIDQNPRILKSDQQNDAFYQELWGRLTSGDVWRGRFINKKKDGTLYIEDATISPVSDTSGKTVNYIAVKRDVTHEVEMEEQLRQKYKMEAIGVMAGGMAHNFNNNLSIILGNVELAQLKQIQNSEAIPLLKNAKIAVLRARDLIQNILTYSRKGTHDKAPITLEPVVNETIGLLRSTIPSTINIEQVISPSSNGIIINADSSQIQEALFNLCNNAVHAMDERGELKILLSSVDLQAQDIPAQYECIPGRYAKLSVQDTGSGMTKETQEKVFDLFFTTKEVNEGTGMGLASVQGLMIHHNGLIKVKSTLGKGTSFDLYFPAVNQNEVTETGSKDENLLHGIERILFVDDDEMLASLGEKLLTEMGYQVTTMTESTEALKLFTANADRIDLVITDQTMPELSGKELIQELKKVRPDIPTILCTGFSSKVNEEEAMELGADAFLMKPLDLPELSQTVRRVLDSESP